MVSFMRLMQRMNVDLPQPDGASIAFMYVLAFHPVEPVAEPDEAPGPEAAVEGEVRAHAFVLVDDEGQPRAALAMKPDGTPALAFTGADGHITWTAP
jgi:hypothetical protein